MIELPAPASFQQAPADAVVNKPVQRKYQATRGIVGIRVSGANEQAVGNYFFEKGLT